MSEKTEKPEKKKKKSISDFAIENTKTFYPGMDKYLKPVEMA